MKYLLSVATALSFLLLPSISAANEEDVFQEAIVATQLVGKPSTDQFGSELLTESREEIAEIIAEDIGIEPEVLEESWKAAPIENQAALFAALSQLGKPYRYASNGPNAFDCSGLTNYAWGEAGIDIPNSSRSQIKAAEDVFVPEAGDLVYYPGHIMIYLGVDNHIIHSANRRTGVTLGYVRKDVTFGRPTLTT